VCKEADMNHHDIDPTLRPAEPLLDSLDDGFSPPADAQPLDAHEGGASQATDLPLTPQSPF
jgi:hypothetical protein